MSWGTTTVGELLKDFETVYQTIIDPSQLKIASEKIQGSDIDALRTSLSAKVDDVMDKIANSGSFAEAKSIMKAVEPETLYFIDERKSAAVARLAKYQETDPILVPEEFEKRFVSLIKDELGR